MAQSSSFDIIVIGGGPGGYPAAIRARQLGLSVALVEAEHLGGICLNWGCIPTKALLHGAELYHEVSHAKRLGIRIEGAVADLPSMVKHSRSVSKRLTTGIKHLLKKNEVVVFDGFGRLAGAGNVLVEKDGAEVARLQAPHIILATGARTRVLPGLEPDGERVWTSKEAMIPESLPGSLLVVGSGAIGMEFASFYSDLGSKVTVVETLPQILPVEDAEIAEVAVKSFEKRGVAFHVESTVTKLDRGGEKVRAVIESASGESQEIEVDRVILAVGIVGNVENLGLEGTGVEVDRTHIMTNEWTETGEPGVYAIGDVAGPPWLAHKATHEGILAAERIAGIEGVEPMKVDQIPGCTYCRPQIASVGLSEARAAEAGREVRIGRFPFIGNGKAIAMAAPEGMIKTVFDAATGELLGAHMVGHGVTELIQGFVVSMGLETTEAELMHSVFPHPTLSEAMHESVLAAYGRAIHI
jgi:dihydrolipoamide dehydrogenase